MYLLLKQRETTEDASCLCLELPANFWDVEKIMWQKPRMVKETPVRVLGGGGSRKKKELKLKSDFFKWQHSFIWVFESLLTALCISGGFSFPCCNVTCISALHFYFSICSPCTCSEVLSVPSCLYVWLLLFLLNFIKNDLCFIQVQNEIPFFIFHDWISQHSECICCRTGQYHLCSTSWATAFRTTAFCQSPSAPGTHRRLNWRPF